MDSNSLTGWGGFFISCTTLCCTFLSFYLWQRFIFLHCGRPIDAFYREKNCRTEWCINSTGVANYIWQLCNSLIVQICSPQARRTRERASSICCVSPNQASLWHCEKLIFVDGVLCTLPWASGVRISPGKPSPCSYWGGIITKHIADSSDTKAALTSSLLVASRGWSRSPLTLLTQTTSHHSREAETSCSITRHETDFFQLQWTGHKPRLTTSSAQTEQGENGWAGTEEKRGVGAVQGTLNKSLFTLFLHLLGWDPIK